MSSEEDKEVVFQKLKTQFSVAITSVVGKRFFKLAQFSEAPMEVYGSDWQEMVYSELTFPDDKDEEMKRRVWEDFGSNMARLALNRRRQNTRQILRDKFRSKYTQGATAACSIKRLTEVSGYVVLPCVEMYQENREEVPDPQNLLGNVREDDSDMNCLRARLQYRDLMKHFARCVCFATTFDKECTVVPLSKIMTPYLEGYLVVLYECNYDGWIKEFGSEDADSVASSITSSSGGKYTSKSSGKYGGWNAEGKTLYNKVAKMLLRQRQDPRLGRRFDEEMMEIYKEMRGNKNKKKTAETRVMALSGVSERHLYEV